MQKSLTCLLWVVVLAASAVLFAAALWLGALNQDEGWYLYAARLVQEGQRPYVDFATTQGPVLPYVYSLIQPAVARWGVAAGRVFTALLGCMAAGLAGWLSMRLCRRWRQRVADGDVACFTAFLLTFALVGMNVYQCYFSSIVKTYALTACLLAGGFLLVSYIGSRYGSPAAFAGGLLMALAAGTRTTAVLAIPAVGVALLLLRRSDIDREAAHKALPGSRHAFFAFSAGAVLGLGGVFLPFLILAPRGLWFALVAYHGGRDVGSLTQMLAYKAGFVARMTHAYFPAIVLLVLALGYCIADRHCRVSTAPGRRPKLWLERALWATVIAVTAAHFLAPFPYDDYQAIVYPLFAAGVVSLFVRVCDRWMPSLRLVVLAMCLLYAGASPMIQSWFIGERDRIWWPMREEFPLQRLQRVGRELRELGLDRGELLLTQDPYLAVETGARLPAGLELGPFSYFPAWPTGQCEALHIVNREMFRKLLAAGEAELAAFSGYGLSIACPSVTELPPAEQAMLLDLVRQRYRLERVVPRFGQADTDLRIFVRRD